MLISTEVGKLIGTKLSFQMKHASICGHDGRLRVRRCAGEHCLPEYAIKRHSGLTPGVMVWGAISYHGRSNLQRIKDNINSNKYVREVLLPEVVPFLCLLIHRITRLLSPCGIWFVVVSLLICALQFQKTNVCCACKQYRILFHKQIFKICLTPCHVVIVAFIAVYHCWSDLIV
ncbi:uncharacterized protein TNCV_4114011 [Trichonephila clavipes]|nr:uncharacterized protein TNCV_4114011 [Trichonephila clavipes]